MPHERSPKISVLSISVRSGLQDDFDNSLTVAVAQVIGVQRPAMAKVLADRRILAQPDRPIVRGGCHGIAQPTQHVGSHRPVGLVGPHAV